MCLKSCCCVCNDIAPWHTWTRSKSTCTMPKFWNGMQESKKEVQKWVYNVNFRTLFSLWQQFLKSKHCWPCSRHWDNSIASAPCIAHICCCNSCFQNVVCWWRASYSTLFPEGSSELNSMQRLKILLLAVETVLNNFVDLQFGNEKRGKWQSPGIESQWFAS